MCLVYLESKCVSFGISVVGKKKGRDSRRKVKGIVVENVSNK